MRDTQNDTTSIRRKFIKSIWAAPMIAAFALGATAVPASAGGDGYNPHEAICITVLSEPFANKLTLLALLGCVPPKPPRGCSDVESNSCD